MNLDWTEDRIEILTKLWADGLSASQIAARLGGTTRSAVIGKVHRLGLPSRVTESKGGRQKGGAYTAPALALPLHPTRFRCPPSGFPTNGNAALKPVFVPVVRTHIVALAISQDQPQALRVDLLDLRDDMCRWPVGDPKDAGFHFCGREKGSKISYCAQHARSAFRPKPQAVR